jgi:hypothetical protein
MVSCGLYLRYIHDSREMTGRVEFESKSSHWSPNETNVKCEGEPRRFRTAGSAFHTFHGVCCNVDREWVEGS